MNFKNWLENNEAVSPFTSSVVPYLVYHGTHNNPFNDFQYKKGERRILFHSYEVNVNGFFFSENPHDALEFGPNVVSCYINLQNPLIDPRKHKLIYPDEFYYNKNRLSYEQELNLQKIFAPLIKKDEKGHYIDINTKKQYIKSQDRKGHEWIYNLISPDGISWQALDTPGVIEKMIKLGYDGTFVAEPDTIIGRSIFIPFANQIRVINWVNGVQDSWKDKDDYYITKKDGYNNLIKPDIN